MKRVSYVLAVSMIGCAGYTISINPPAKKHSVVHHHHAKPKPKNHSTIVDSDWLMQYRQLEEEHNYRLGSDEAVSVGNGKYRVTKPMLEHFSALSQAPPPATPTP